MKVYVYRIQIPAMSTVGYGWGETVDEPRQIVKFAGDHRPMRHLGEAMAEGSIENPIVTELDDWQILSLKPVH